MASITSTGPSPLQKLQELVEQMRSVMNDMSAITIEQNPDLLNAIKEITDNG